MKKIRQPKIMYKYISKATLDNLIDKAIQLKLNKIHKKLRKKAVSAKKRSVQNATVEPDWGVQEYAQLFLIFLCMMISPRLLDFTWPPNFRIDCKLSTTDIIILVLMLLFVVFMLVFC
ncbi:uncharacterized protein LOC111070438 [Drosophila obscura]|uniref:uncharacterized protein LOC111070438 n=1 Tax=Drosophila obscura TaxID=7282 RepID=UPI001BB2883E|nr:uncharacterized protein LOC111070438 [Drosophila obscura]